MDTSTLRSQPLVISSSVESQVYGLFAVAMGLTTLGVYLGSLFAGALLNSGILLIFLVAELILIFTSRWWAQSSPLNFILFAVFPFLSGITVTPYLMGVADAYTNGASILLNALLSTTFMALGAVVVARMTGVNTGVLGRTLLFSVIGLLVMGILQLFFPALQTGMYELLLSGAGVIVFATFTAYDLQRIQAMSRFGANPFLLALSLYLDIFNLFLYVLRFMVALSGNRR